MSIQSKPEVNNDAATICMYVPSADGGHPLYARQLLHALQSARSALEFELVTAVDLAAQFDADAYRINRVLPPLRHRNDYPNRLLWAADRTLYYPRREKIFLEWLVTRPDIVAVHLHEWQFWLMPWLVKRIIATGRQVFATIHNVYPHRYPTGVPKSLFHSLVRRGCQQCAGLFVHTPRLADELKRFMNGDAPPVHVVPHGAWDLTHDWPPVDMTQRMGKRRLLFFGVLRRNKGLHVLLRAARLMPEFAITIAGSPQEKDYFESECLPLIRGLQARGHRVDVRAEFISDADAADLFATHSAVVLPYADSFMAQSGVVFMAMAHGIPVVATGAGGLRELLDEFPIGTICDHATPEALVEATRRLFETVEPKLLEEQLQAAREHYSWTNAAEATLRGYATLGQEVPA